MKRLFAVEPIKRKEKATHYDTRYFYDSICTEKLENRNLFQLHYAIHYMHFNFKPMNGQQMKEFVEMLDRYNYLKSIKDTYTT